MTFDSNDNFFYEDHSHSIDEWSVHTGLDRRLVANKRDSRFVGHTSDISAIVLSDDGKLLPSATESNVARVWDTQTAQ